jgi:flagellar hook assembly protein FlgD
MKEPAHSRVDVYNRNGSRVKAANLGWRTGPLSWSWNGRNARGAVFAAGRYRVVVTAVDLRGNVLKTTYVVTLYAGRH